MKYFYVYCVFHHTEGENETPKQKKRYKLSWHKKSKNY